MNWHLMNSFDAVPPRPPIVLTKHIVKSMLKVKSDAALGRKLGIKRATTSMWPEHEPIPELRQWQVAALLGIIKLPKQRGQKRTQREVMETHEH